MTNVNSATIAVTAASTAYSGALLPRYEFVSVLNESGLEVWVRTDGTAATIDGDFCTAIPPGGNPVVVANMQPLWDQSQTVIPAGSVNQWGQARNGGTSNPGTTVSVIGAPNTGTINATAGTVTIQGAG